MIIKGNGNIKSNIKGVGKIRKNKSIYNSSLNLTIITSIFGGYFDYNYNVNGNYIA